MLTPLIVLTAEETVACRRLVELALEEDLNSTGDVTSQAIIPEELTGRAVLAARTAGVLAGLPAAAQVFHTVDPKIDFRPVLDDGAWVQPGDRLGIIAGRVRSLLAAERTALNFLQHLSGIATLTRQYVDALAGLPCKILDTRKTLPGWRRVQKYAVRCGGGHNHRLGLFDGILIKDNHLAALPQKASAIADSVRAARDRWAGGFPLEIEVDNLDQFDEALRAWPDIILLDNMKVADMREAVGRRNSECGEDSWILVEASGGVTLENVRAIAETGVDRISVGALTHSAPALDVALDYVDHS
jgi:nicotinate-nucleotide pyrophosphorylase (carboxylating)